MHSILDDMKKILFIGNSYTYVNNLPQMFSEVAAAAGISVTVSSVTKGGWTLEKHADPADVCGAQVQKAFAENQYDYVILQEQSYRPIVKSDLFAAAVHTLAKLARANGAQPILYATWGRADGCPLLTELSLTSAEMTAALADAYTKVGAAENIPVAHVGRAWQAASGADLYHADLSHPAPAGTYLAALTLLAKIFAIDPMQIPYTPDFLSAEADVFLKTAAKTAV